jgi:hypothetical protein
MERSLWKAILTSDRCPAWPCPICNRGILKLVPKSLTRYETATSKAGHGEDEFDESWVDYVFSAWAKCTHFSCGQDFALSGKGGVEPTMSEEGEIEYDDYFELKHCCPMPDIISLPKTCPDEVKIELRASFQLFFLNKAACVGRIRTALERLMDFVGIPARRRAKGRILSIALHERIEIYSRKKRALGDRLMAIKWLGNTAVHTGALSSGEILDGYEILEHTLSEIIENKSARIDKLAKALSKRHGKT